MNNFSYLKIFLGIICLITLIALVDEYNSEENLLREASFEYIHKHKNIWKGTESISESGSTIQATITLRCLLPAIIQALDIHTLLDAGCGDLNWIKDTPLNVDSYIGVDIVSDIIENNKTKYSADKLNFFCRDITKDQLPYADLILCRDCLQHLSYKDIKAAINNFKASKSIYLLTTNYVNLKKNKNDIVSGNFHIINLMKEPFNFPEPIILFDELSAEYDMRIWRKGMCVWRLSDLPIMK
jgi:hypothetical protein